MSSAKDTGLEQAEQRIARIIGSVLGFTINPGVDDLDTLHLDSLSRLEILALLEKEFGVELTEDIVSEFKSISRIARILRQSRHVSRNRPSDQGPLPTP